MYLNLISFAVKERETTSQLSICWLKPQLLTKLRLGRLKTGSPSRSPLWVAETKHLSHHLPLPGTSAGSWMESTIDEIQTGILIWIMGIPSSSWTCSHRFPLMWIFYSGWNVVGTSLSNLKTLINNLPQIWCLWMCILKKSSSWRNCLHSNL